MENITTLVQRQIRGKAEQQPQCVSSDVCRQMRLPETRSQLLQKFNPSVQKYALENIDRCFFGAAPTLAAINRAYGANTAAQWITIQLFDLSEFCGCKQKISEASLEQCAYIIAQTYYYLKMSEMMLFFQYFKSGKYGIFYGAVDAMKITTALREFCSERGNVIARHDQELQRKKNDEYRKQAISRQEYDSLTKKI